MSNRRTLSLVVALSILLVLTIGSVATAGGAAYTTYNAHVDGNGKDVCKNSEVNCNIYGKKEYVWLNGGPDGATLPEGWYFFAVLEPGGQPDPNDGGAKNLSDDYDSYTNRTFYVDETGEVALYDGDHWLDDGKNGPKPNWKPPYIRLFPYEDTTNPGGVYKLAICSLEDEYPVEPRDCKYDSFKVARHVEYQFLLEGIKFYDRDADGDKEGDPGIEGWRIHITGTDPYGEPIDVIVETGEGGYWSWESGVYKFAKKDTPGDVSLLICEIMPDEGNWVQTFPPDGACHTLEFTPSGFEYYDELDFGNICYAYADFDTKGYWHNKNGLQELTEEDIAYVNELDPYDSATSYFENGDEPFDGYFEDPPECVAGAFNDDGSLIWGECTWQAEVSHFLVDANANGDPREQLAQQLLAFIFNSIHRLDDPAAGIMLPDGTWMGAQALIDWAIEVWGDVDPVLQEQVKTLLDELNNNDEVPYVPYDPCPVIYY